MLQAPSQGGIMRTWEDAPVKEAFQVCLSVSELHFYIVLLTGLRADDLIDEASRRRAIEDLTRKWLVARQVTGKQSSVSAGDATEQ